MKIDSLLRLLVDQKGSDLFLSVGIEPCLKVNGKLVALGTVRLDDEMVSEFIREVMTPAAYERYCQCHEANFAIQRPELGRFRVSCFWQMGCPGMVLRRIDENAKRHGQSRSGLMVEAAKAAMHP